ncbi:unnamed protein product, partial [Ceratitis capitata]
MNACYVTVYKTKESTAIHSASHSDQLRITLLKLPVQRSVLPRTAAQLTPASVIQSTKRLQKPALTQSNWR